MVPFVNPTPSSAEVEGSEEVVKVGPSFARGTFGTVHPCKLNGEDAVVKLPRVHVLPFHVNGVLLLGEVDDVKRVRRREEMLQEEAKVLQLLRDCPCVVPWLCNIRAWVDGVQVRGMALQKMDCSLRQLWTDSTRTQLNVNQNRCRSVRLAGILGSAVNIFFALGRMHESGFCHMDITPENLLWSEANCQLYLADFGSAARRPGFTWRELQDLPERANIRQSYALAFRGVWEVLPELHGQFQTLLENIQTRGQETASDMKVELPLADPRLDYFALAVILRYLLGFQEDDTGINHLRPTGVVRSIPHSFRPRRQERPWGQADRTWPSLLEAALQLRALEAALQLRALEAAEHELKEKGDSFLDDALRTCLQDLAESHERLMRLQELDLWRGRLSPGPSGPLVFWQRDSSGTPVRIMSFDLGKLGEKPERLVHEAKKELAECLGCCPPQIKLWALLRPRYENLEEEVLPGMSSEQLDSPLLRVEVMPVKQLQNNFEFSQQWRQASYHEVWYWLNSRHVHPENVVLKVLIDAGPGPSRAMMENRNPRPKHQFRSRLPAHILSVQTAACQNDMSVNVVLHRRTSEHEEGFFSV
ncbi:unnamed protein product [Symbiodinium sp. CCMP2592]|nr:unnamed protein product [Symbiodinium sp. CCMP2592]